MLVSAIQCSLTEIINFFSIKILILPHYAKYLDFRVSNEERKVYTRDAYKLSR